MGNPNEVPTKQTTKTITQKIATKKQKPAMTSNSADQQGDRIG
jgi:hypothetical protein